LSNSEKQETDVEEFADVIGDAMAYVANEAVILARLEGHFTPKPAILWREGEQGNIKKRLDNVIEKMGGSPESFLHFEGDPLPIYDTYSNAALNEVIATFYRARKSVSRAHLFKVGSQLQNEHPEWLNLSTDNKFNSEVCRISENTFWEHAETAYIRLTSYWDRVGQLLDFAFFNIRQFERDGFSAVFDRIRTNIIPINSDLKNISAWKEIRAYQTSEKEDGLKWLLRRRNITVHSLHLRAPKDQMLMAS